MSEQQDRIVVTCDCGKRFRAKVEHIGRKRKCPECGTVLTIEQPAPSGSTSEKPEPVDGPSPGESWFKRLKREAKYRALIAMVPGIFLAMYLGVHFAFYNPEDAALREELAGDEPAIERLQEGKGPNVPILIAVGLIFGTFVAVMLDLQTEVGGSILITAGSIAGLFYDVTGSIVGGIAGFLIGGAIIGFLAIRVGKARDAELLASLESNASSAD